MKNFTFALSFIAFFALVFGFTACNSSNEVAAALTNKFIQDTILSLKEVKAKNMLIDSLTKHQQGISLIIENPTDQEPAFYIQAGFNGKERFETYFHFYLDTATKQIEIRDWALGKRVLLSNWRKQDLESVYLKLGMDLLNSESVEGLEIGMEEYKIVNLLGKPDASSIPSKWESDGLMHQTWTYTAKAVNLDLSWDKGDSKVISSITLSKPNSFKTNRKIGIGSTREQVRGAYIIEIDPRENNGNSVVAGSVFGGLIFEFENDTVISIFIGAAAE